VLTLIGIVEPPRQAGINAGLSLWGLVCVMTAAQFIDRLGRRVLWMQGLIGMFVWFSFITALSVSLISASMAVSWWTGRFRVDW
jgi:hypothetical protein